jgi:protocatechuate 3,4-dioxygenase beta subunit
MKPGTPSQTVGPFFHPSMQWAVRPPETPLGDGELLVEGTITDARGEIVSNAVLEIWQPHATVADPAAPLPGFQRVFTAADGRFAFALGLPRQRTADQGATAGLPFAHVTILSLGLMGALRTRVYLGASPDDLRRVDQLRNVPPERLSTLIAAPTPDPRRYVWSVRLQGEGETVFFAIDLNDRQGP